MLKQLGIESPVGDVVGAKKEEIKTVIELTEDESKKLLAANQKLLDEIASAKVDAIADGELKDRAKAELEYARKVTEINLSIGSEKLKNEALQAEKLAHEKAIEAITKKYDNIAGEAAFEQLTNEINAAKTEGDEKVKTAIETAKKLKDIKDKDDAARADDYDKIKKEKEKNKKDLIDGAKQIEQELSNTIFAAQQARIQREQSTAQQASETLHNTEAEKLQAQLTSKEINQKQFEIMVCSYPKSIQINFDHQQTTHSSDNNNTLLIPCFRSDTKSQRRRCLS